MKVSVNSQCGLILQHNAAMGQTIFLESMTSMFPDMTAETLLELLGMEPTDALVSTMPREQAQALVDVSTHRELLFSDQFQHYLISPQARELARKVNVTDDIDFKLLDAIKPQYASYLLGPTETIRVIVMPSELDRDGKNHLFYLHIRDAPGGRSMIGVATMFHEEGLDTGMTPELRDSAKEMLRLLIFLNLGEIETVRLPPKSKKQRGVTTFKNESGVEVTYVNARWNTLVIRDHEFSVDGHFRLQAWGPRHSLRRLTWINPHKRSGYTRLPGAKTAPSDGPK